MSNKLAKFLVLGALLLLIDHRGDHKKWPVHCSDDHLHSIQYDDQTNIDYYSALPSTSSNKLQTQTTNQVAGITNLKALLQQQQHHNEDTNANQPLPHLQAPLGRSRQAKQISDFQAKSDNVCLTPGCVKAAAEILKNIDDKVDPCDDFYRYSCGNWIDSQVIPEDKTSVSLFSVVQDELDNKLRNLIEREPTSADAPIVGRMRNLYESCMNTSKYTSQLARFGWPHNLQNLTGVCNNLAQVTLKTSEMSHCLRSSRNLAVGQSCRVRHPRHPRRRRHQTSNTLIGSTCSSSSAKWASVTTFSSI